MKFDNVSIVGVAHVDAPHRIPSEDLDARLSETYRRLGMPARLLESLTGVKARRFWDVQTQPSDAATLAGRKVLADTGVDPARIGALINTSVCRDYVEPSVACFVHANLGLPETCLNFDIANACLGFIDGMHLVGNLIERGQIEFGLIVDGESSRTVVEATLARLSLGSCDAQMLRDQLATLTVGSGAAAMILAHTRLAPGGHRFHGGTSLAATEHNQLCRGQLDVGITDTRSLLLHGVGLAQRTWATGPERAGLERGIRRSVCPAPGERVAHARAGPRGRLRSREGISHLPGTGQRGSCLGSHCPRQSGGGRARVAGRPHRPRAASAAG